ncbi:AsnC family transcriptional regulator [Clostridium scatologenes]|uniref:siroheme decarboxylase n=1 Tax=Clostridium scatologenes TaxID=1548 RepID=A0A0E3K197_CLOSL|nr:AsnC family transcriptional regulator [Clostridium scatologenes]AKA69764.1 putative transcriptional regulator, AsnC family [Clostridium scatologenes]
MDNVDKQLLNLLQEGLPVEYRPFLVLGKKLGVSEQEIISRIEKLKSQGYIRRLGGIFDSKNLGYFSTLCAMKVPEKSIDYTAKIVNSYDEITHNYIRDDEYNMWFTIIAPSEHRIIEIIENIKKKTSIGDILNLPSSKVFKVKVSLDVINNV